MTTYFVGAKPSLEDLAHYGVKGMHWGVRKDYKDAQKNFSRASVVVNDRQTKRRLNTSLSEEEYKQLSVREVVFKKGSLIKRTSESPQEDSTSDKLFVSTNEKDAKRYNALIPTGKTGGVPGKKQQGYYETTFQAMKDLRSPSERERVNAYIRMMDQPAIKLASGETVTGKEYLRRQGLGDAVDKLSSRQLALTYYGQLAVTQGIKNDPINTAYFKLIADKGYNALIDDNDRRIIADEPLLVFDAHKNLKNVNVKQLTTEEVHKAQAELRLPGET